MRYLTCQDQFIEDIIALVKQTTLRCKARCKPGDTIVFRRWVGKPRQKGSRQVTFGTAKCLAVVTNVGIYPNKIQCSYDGLKYLLGKNLDEIAIRDGFTSWTHLIAWFRKNHPGGDWWEMDMIYWGNTFVPTKAENVSLALDAVEKRWEEEKQ